MHAIYINLIGLYYSSRRKRQSLKNYLKPEDSKLKKQESLLSTKMNFFNLLYLTNLNYITLLKYELNHFGCSTTMQNIIYLNVFFTIVFILCRYVIWMLYPVLLLFRPLGINYKKINVKTLYTKIIFIL